MLRDEADFANRDYVPYADRLAINRGMFRKYARPTDTWDWRQMGAILLGDLAGKELLDFGCGMGEEAIYFAKLGASVTAIDISEVGVASLKKRAAYHRLDVRAYEMRCDPTSFPDESFDRIHGMGILHHVGIETALSEVRRLLPPRRRRAADPGAAPAPRRRRRGDPRDEVKTSAVPSCKHGLPPVWACRRFDRGTSGANVRAIKMAGRARVEPAQPARLARDSRGAGDRGRRVRRADRRGTGPGRARPGDEGSLGRDAPVRRSRGP